MQGDQQAQRASQQLQALAQLANQAVGDALSGLLMVEAALQLLQLDMQAWSTLYTDLPSRQLKVQHAPFLYQTVQSRLQYHSCSPWHTVFCELFGDFDGHQVLPFESWLDDIIDVHDIA